MKSRLLFSLFVSLFLTNYIFSNTIPLPYSNFNVATDVGYWSVASNTATKTWFNGGCKALYVDNLPSNPSNLSTTITSSIFSVSQTSDYILEIEHAVIYSATPAIFELIDSSITVINSTSSTIAAGTCTSWPAAKFGTVIFSNINSGNYQLRITIPKSQFFLSSVKLGVYKPITISGSVNNTSCTNSNMLNGFPIKITNLSNNNISYTTTTNGTYSFVLNNVSGNFLIEGVSSGNIVSIPNSINLTINTSSTSYLNNNFCLASNITGIDVEAQLASIDLARPGFVANYNLIYRNNGDTTTGSAESIVLNFDNSKLNYVNLSASTPPTNVTSNSLTWTYSNLTPLEIRNITMSFNILPPPTVNSGEILNFTGNITPTTDVNVVNNNFNLNQMVVNAYDPNDVLCLDGSEISPAQIGNYLTYRIRFQNTGTAPAVNIVVKTDLDAELDWSTFQPISESHAYTASVTSGNELSFTFNNINLDDSNTNEPESHGWIFYKVKPKSSAVIGDSFDATSNIFFDFNSPVITNTYTTTIAASLTYVPDDNFETRLIELGHDSGPLDNYVPTVNINTLTTIDLEDQGIMDLTGIEDFVALEFLYCHTNLISNLNVSSNINLTTLVCSNNLLTTLDVTHNPNLTYLGCSQNQLSNLSINNSSLLIELLISYNLFTSFDASGFPNLIDFRCNDNQLTSLNIKNGNNTNFVLFEAQNNPGLTCIIVDNASWSANNWTNKDVISTFINSQAECTTLNIDSSAFNEFKLYPNPIKEAFVINVKHKSVAILYTLIGKEIYKIKLQEGKNNINVENLNSGVYLLKYLSSTQSKAIKILIE